MPARRATGQLLRGYSTSMKSTEQVPDAHRALPWCFTTSPRSGATSPGTGPGCNRTQAVKRPRLDHTPTGPPEQRHGPGARRRSAIRRADHRDDARHRRCGRGRPDIGMAESVGSASCAASRPGRHGPLRAGRGRHGGGACRAGAAVGLCAVPPGPGPAAASRVGVGMGPDRAEMDYPSLRKAGTTARSES
jgi:hypothetical protein